MAPQVELVTCLKATDATIELGLSMDSVPMGFQPLLCSETLFTGRTAMFPSLVLANHVSVQISFRCKIRIAVSAFMTGSLMGGAPMEVHDDITRESRLTNWAFVSCFSGVCRHVGIQFPHMVKAFVTGVTPGSSLKIPMMNFNMIF